MGRGIARKLLSNHILNFIDLSKDYTLAEVVITDPTFVNQNLIQLNLRQRFDLTVIAIQRGQKIDISPDPTAIVQLHDILTVVGPVKQVEALDETLKK